MIPQQTAIDNARRLCAANPNRPWLQWHEASATAILRQDLPVSCWEIMIGDPPKQNWFDYEMDDAPTRLFFNATNGEFYGFQSMRGIVTIDQIKTEITIP